MMCSFKDPALILFIVNCYRTTFYVLMKVHWKIWREHVALNVLKLKTTS